MWTIDVADALAISTERPIIVWGCIADLKRLSDGYELSIDSLYVSSSGIVFWRATFVVSCTEAQFEALNPRRAPSFEDNSEMLFPTNGIAGPGILYMDTTTVVAAIKPTEIRRATHFASVDPSKVGSDDEDSEPTINIDADSPFYIRGELLGAQMFGVDYMHSIK